VRTCRECARARSLASSDSVCVSTCVRVCENNKETHVPSTTVQRKAVPTHSLVGGTVIVIVIETVAAALGDVVERFDQR
jgi:hypothetical protein